LGSSRGYFQLVPPGLSMNLNFFRKNGYTIHRQDSGWMVQKVGGLT